VLWQYQAPTLPQEPDIRALSRWSKQGGEISAEYWAAESVRASASYDHSTIDQSRLEIEIQDVARLGFFESGDVRELLGWHEACG
jgi:hypothetical protein